MNQRGGYRGYFEQRDALLLEGARPLSGTLSELPPGRHRCRIEKVLAVPAHNGFEFLAAEARGGTRRRWLCAFGPEAVGALFGAASIQPALAAACIVGREVGLHLLWDDGV